MSSNKIQRISDLISDAREFTFCGPSDDPDEQTAVCVGYRHLIIQLQRLAAPVLPEAERERLNSINVEIDNIYSVYEANAELDTLLPDIEIAIADIDADLLNIGTAAKIVEPTVIERLEALCSKDFDTAVLVRLCKEINSCFFHGNIVATALMMRTVLNYIPPVFGHTTFSQVTAQSGKSMKTAFSTLEEGLRKIADFHAHRKITAIDIYPSAIQVEPYKPQFAVLLDMVLSKLSSQE